MQQLGDAEVRRGEAVRNRQGFQGKSTAVVCPQLQQLGDAEVRSGKEDKFSLLPID